MKPKQTILGHVRWDSRLCRGQFLGCNKGDVPIYMTEQEFRKKLGQYAGAVIDQHPNQWHTWATKAR